MSGVLLAFMESNDKAVDDLVHLLMINRVYAAQNLGEDVTFATPLRRKCGEIPPK